MKKIDLQVKNAVEFLKNTDIKSLNKEADDALKTLRDGSGKGADFLGWLSLPDQIPADEINRIKMTAKSLREKCRYVVVIGIGGSYLGAKAVIDALADPFDAYHETNPGNTKVLFAGQNISEDYLASLCQLLENRPFGIIVISKSGTTTEPAIAFRLLRNLLEKNVGKNEARKLIIAITDAKKGALRQLSDTEGFETFVIPDNVGGRFSVLTPVGLLPIAVADFDIEALLSGAKEMMGRVLTPSDDNPAIKYAILRNAFYREGKKIELLVNFNPRLHFIAEWWKQLYGESEGKEHKGIFPASVDFTTDLHSMGQWIQQGERSIFETVISVESPSESLTIPFDKENLDGINFMADKHIDYVNHKAEEGTRLAHNDGGVPVIKIALPEISEATLGQLIYFFETACGISGYMLGVNPFDQPGVEDYKRNMFALLGKPGYEELALSLNKRIKS